MESSLVTSTAAPVADANADANQDKHPKRKADDMAAEIDDARVKDSAHEPQLKRVKPSIPSNDSQSADTELVASAPMEIDTGKQDPPATSEIQPANSNNAALPTPANRDGENSLKPTNNSRSLSVDIVDTRQAADPDGLVAREQDVLASTPNNTNSAGPMVLDLEAAAAAAASTRKTKVAASTSSTSSSDSSTVDPPDDKDGGSNEGTDKEIKTKPTRKASFDRVPPPEPRPTRSRSNSRAQPSEVVSSLIDLPKLNTKATMAPLSPEELRELAIVLEITEEDGWRDDWSGNLALVDKEITNPKRSRSGKEAGSFRQALFVWAQKSNATALKHLHYLFRYVYHLEDTPAMAKTILANADRKDGNSLELAFRRVSYDPTVLQQDGWTTAKAPAPVGATGGAHRIGEKVRWQGADGIVIAYVHDHDLGDLWRGIWLEESLESFDMEAEELLDARRKWERRAAKSAGADKGKGGGKQNQKKQQDQDAAKHSRRSHRYTSANDFRIQGVEHGIVLAASFSRGARPGVYWPARVMHASEAATVPGAKNKRNAPRQRLDLVFLAPYWNSGNTAAAANASSSRNRPVESFSESLSRHGESLFSSGPLFDVESVDVAEDMIKAYPYDRKDGGINIDQLRVAFRFSGLPKAAFSRFLDSHRLALALKTYAQQQLPPRGSDQVSAGLFETHAMSVTAPIFPPEILHLPYIYLLSQLPVPPCEQIVHDGEERNVEPILQLQSIIESMKPPSCWGETTVSGENGSHSPAKRNSIRVAESPFIDANMLLRKTGDSGESQVDVEYFSKDLTILKQAIVGGTNVALESMLQSLHKLLSSVTSGCAKLSAEEKQVKARALARSWVFIKANGEDAIGSSAQANRAALASEWRRACERIYKYITFAFSSNGYGNGVSFVLTDYRCNGHLTGGNGCFERTVRLPAALKAARDAGAGKKDNVQLATTVEKKYVEMAENKVLMKAHSAAYLRRMKARCSQIQNDKIVYLTEDSDGNGGEDTKGSRGTWMAAVAGVGTAIKAVDMVVDGKCVNAFCATRPPGHHAGRDLHPMKAVSNGFCILNTAACAALYATTPLSEGGPGLRRVCVIDFDVHHGNGTQDILCSTYDPRFLYVSLHAGGAHVNGLPDSDDFGSEIHQPGGNSQKKGIYPGRCGDSSPHRGVLNIPLGPRVTSHAVGISLINDVTPTVEAFSPDLIILSAGFDAHKNDPLGLGGLSADDFGHITDVACHLASKCCSGRLISLLEGGYGVPCCRPQKNLFLPPETKSEKEQGSGAKDEEVSDKEKIDSNPPKQQQGPERPQPSKLLELGGDLPDDMEDQVPYALQRRLEKCHAEGFIECVKGHVTSLVKCNKRS